jgi:steroid delta-isomerase
MREINMAGSAVELAFERHVAAVHSGDREAFLSNFAEDALVEDPVGPSPLDPSGSGHRGLDAIGAFWDKMIGPGSVRFEIDRSFVCGDEIANVGTIHNELPDGAGEIGADGVFVYRVNGDGKIVSLKAYWDYEKSVSGVAL